MNLTPPDRMEPAAIVAEIASLRQELDSRFSRIQGLAQSLYQRVRRAPADDNTAIYMRFASTWTRFSGMAGQGLKRASAGGRVLKGLTPEAPAESIVKPPIRQAPVASTPVESLLNMYREDSDLTDGVIQAVVDGDASGTE